MAQTPRSYDLWCALLRRSDAQSGQHLIARVVRVMVAVLARLVAVVQRVRFPARRTGGWWWGARWRLEWLLGWSEWGSVQRVRPVAVPGAVFIDVGAHIGYYTRLVSRWVGAEGRVLAVEPHPENVRALRHNTSRLSNVEVVAGAVGATPGTADLWESPGSSNHSLYAGYVGSQRALQVEVTTVDDLVRSRGLTRVDLVKVDVEGAESVVLAGMRAVLTAHRPVLLVESNPAALAAAGTGVRGLVELLEDYGYEVRSVSDEGHLDPVDPDGEETTNLLCRPADDFDSCGRLDH